MPLTIPRTLWNRERKRKGLCLQCDNVTGPTSTVRCEPCHDKKLAKERGVYRVRKLRRRSK